MSRGEVALMQGSRMPVMLLGWALGFVALGIAYGIATMIPGVWGPYVGVLVALAVVVPVGLWLVLARGRRARGGQRD